MLYKSKKFKNFVWFVDPNTNEFIFESDREKLANIFEEEKDMMTKNFEKEKEYKYSSPPILGWCDYPEQFFEKCPGFIGTVKFSRLLRNNVPNYILEKSRDSAEYIGNHKLISYTEFKEYTGTNYNSFQILPKIDEIWKFETDKYTKNDFIFNVDKIIKRE